MIDNPTNGEESTFKPTRRQLLRIGAATTGTATVGSIPSLSDLDGPIGQSRAIAVSGTAIVVGAAAIAVVGAATADVVSEMNENIDAYNQISAATQAKRSELSDIGEIVGINWDASEGDKNTLGSFQTDLKTSQLANNATESYMEEASLAYDEGLGVAEAKQRARSRLRVEITKSEWQVVLSWNAFVESIAGSLEASYNSGWLFDEELFYTGNTENSGDTTETIPWGEGPDSDLYDEFVGNPDSYSGPDDHGLIGIRPIKQYTKLETDDELPDDDFPEDRSQMQIQEIALKENSGFSDRITLLSPYAGLDIGSGDVDLETDAADVSTASLGSGVSDLYAEHPTTGEIDNLEIWKYQHLIHGIRKIYDDIYGKLGQNVENIYAELDAGNVEVSDFTSLSTVSDRANIDDETTREQIAAVSAGMSPPSDGVVATVRIGGGEERTGTLLLDIPEGSQNYQSGDVIPSSQYDQGYFFGEDGSTTSLDGSQDIEIVSIDGTDQLEYQENGYIGSEAVDRQAIREAVRSDATVYEALSDSVEESLLGIGGVGSSGGILLAAIAIIGGYLIGS